jgi:hypothetical protein
VIATNSVDSSTGFGEDFATARQIAGTARVPLELDDSGQTFIACPATASIDWGDGTDPEQITPDCTPGDGEEIPSTFSISTEHTYAEPGHYAIQISYPDTDQTSTQFAQIADTTRRLRRTTRYRRSREPRPRGTR